MRKNAANQEESSYSHILKYTGLFGGVQGLVILIGLVRNKVMAVLLGASGIGFASLMTSMQNFAAQCTSLGLSFGSVPRLSAYYEQGNYQRLNYFIMVIRLWSLIAAFLGLLFCLFASSFVDSWSFTWGNHTLHYAILGFSVAMMAITGGETAILKATRCLGNLARIQIYTALASVVLSFPLYYFLRQSGIVPAILLISLATMIATLSYSYRRYPLRMVFRKRLLTNGIGMIKLGVAFVLATAVGSASEMIVRSFLNVEGDLDTVGLYNAAYMITITYAGLVFSSMDSDFFPRLSASHQNIASTNEIVNKQIEVSLLLLSPMLVALLMSLPLLIPLLFSSDFIPVIAMAQVSVLAMYFKSMTMPVAYITLARSQSLTFFFLEAAYYLALVVSVIVGYRLWGIYGTGIAIVVAHVFEFLMVYTFAYAKFDYRCTYAIARYAAVQLSLGAVAFVVSLFFNGWIYWITEAALVVVSTAYTVRVLRQKTHLWASLKSRFKI